MYRKVTVEAGPHDFASQLCNAMGVFAYVVVGRTGESPQMSAYGGWAGTLPEGVLSLAPHVAYGKMGELVVIGGGLDGQLIMTPTEGNELGYGWMGAVAQNGLIIAVSKWAQEHDRLLALLTLYNQIHYPLTLHHAGFRFKDVAEYEVANALYRNGMVRNIAGDHDRTYFPMEDGHYREHQWFPNGPHDNARHWDFVVDAPKDFLQFVAHAYGQEPVLFNDAGKNDPIGMVWVTSAKDGSKMGVMARRQWWNVEGG